MKVALSNVAVHWAVKVDLWRSSKNRPIVDMRRWECKGVYVCLYSRYKEVVYICVCSCVCILCSFMRGYMCVSFMRVYFVFIHACVYLCSFMRVYICVHSCVYICVKIDR